MKPLTAEEIARERNVVSAALSIVPGLGHIYKGHYAAGLLLMGLGAPLTLWMGMLLALATAGVGLILPLIGWGIVAIDAFYEDDRRKVHPLL